MFHSQCNQDEILERFVFKGLRNGVFVDVGAHDGVSLNNTLYFERNNDWTGVNIEPIEKVFNKLIESRPKCININLAVSDKNGYEKFLINSGYTEMLSGLKSKIDPRHMNRIEYENGSIGGTSDLITVETKRLDSIFDENNIKHINYLSIDVEGAEFQVIKSIDFDKVFIDVIGFENNYYDTSIPIMEYLQNKGYTVFNHKKYLDVYCGDIFMIHKCSQFFNYN